MAATAAAAMLALPAAASAVSPGCSLQFGPALDSCSLVASDTASASDPLSFWGAIDCQSASRYQHVTSGGDTHPTALGAPQGDDAFRHMTVLDGDDFYGERCELGKNDHRSGPTTFYREGQHRVTFVSLRLPANYPLADSTWQSVLRMKQSQPSANGGGTPVLGLNARDGRWIFEQSDSSGPSSNTHEVWSIPAQTETWTRFAFDIRYSQDPSLGSITIYVDLNGDGDAADSGEQSPEIQTYTLKRETEGGSSTDGIAPGESIPSHLRVGAYHNPTIPCPSPNGCSVDVDNVQVVGAGSMSG